MHIPAELLYAETHEWVRLTGRNAVIGITDFAQHSLGDITYVDLPSVGDALVAGREMGVVESVKAASDLYAPVSGVVVAVNESLADQPERINQSPYDEGWMIRAELSDEPSGLLSADDYGKTAHD
jgi:glycine cleavage system H protein